MHRRVAPAAGALTFALLVAALVFLQVLSSQKDLLPFLEAYAAIGIASLIAALAATFPVQAGAAAKSCVLATLIFCGYVVARALTSPVSYVARADLYLVLAALTVYALAVTFLNTPGKRFALVIALLLAGLAHVVVSVAQVIRGGSLSLLIPALQSIEEGSRETRGAGLYVSPNHLAGLLELLGALGLGIACWSRRPAWARVCIGYLAASCYAGVALSGSRGGYLGVAASVLVFALLSLLVLGKAGGRQLLKFSAIGLIVGSLLGVGLWTLLQQNATLTEKLQKIVTDPARLDLWRAAIEQWKLQPWTGTGSGTYLYYGREFRAPTMQMDPVDVHNDYLHLLAEYGLIGAAAFLLFFCAHVWRGWKTFAALGLRRVAAGAPPLSDRLALTIGALSALAAYVVHSAVDYNLHIAANALLVALVFAVLAAPGLVEEERTRSAVPRLTPRFAVAIPALALLLLCIRHLPGEYFADRARLALWREDSGAAAELALKALEHEGQNPHIYFYLGRALRASAADLADPEEQRPLYETAIKAHAKAQRLAPLDATYPLEQAMLYDKLGRFEQAEQMFARAQARDPRAVYIAQEYRAHQELWDKSRTQSPSPPPAQPAPGGEP